MPRIADCVTANCTNLFDVSYEILLQALERYFAHAKESDAQLGAVADATIALMVRVLTPLGGLLTTLAVAPAGRRGAGRHRRLARRQLASCVAPSIR